MKNFKNIAVFFFIFWMNFAFACDACKLQQPKITQNFTHGVGPQGQFDWIIVSAIAVITIFTLVFSIKFLMKPGEKDKNHIKNLILN